MNNTVPFSATARACLGCGEPLPKYHRGDYCNTCRDKGPDALDAELDRASTERKVTKTVSLPPGCKLIPCEVLPGRVQTWAQELIEAFLASGIKMAKVETPLKKPDAAQGRLSEVIRKEPRFKRQVYATQRLSECYLVRVEQK